MTPRDRAMTQKEVAEMLSVSTRTVRRLVRRGELRVTRIGRQTRVLPNDLRTYLGIGERDEEERDVQ